MKDWKTTLFGTIAGLGSIIAQAPAGTAGMPASTQGWAGIAAAVSMLLLGYFARDKKPVIPQAGTNAVNPPTTEATK